MSQDNTNFAVHKETYISACWHLLFTNPCGLHLKYCIQLLKLLIPSTKQEQKSITSLCVSYS